LIWVSKRIRINTCIARYNINEKREKERKREREKERKREREKERKREREKVKKV
jgi:hypothetical protein